MSKAFGLEMNGNRVAIDLDEVGEQTPGGLYVPQTAQQEGPKKGKVVAVSDGYYVNGVYIESRFKKDDHVLVDTLGATKIVVDQREYVVVRNEDIVGRYWREHA